LYFLIDSTSEMDLLVPLDKGGTPQHVIPAQAGIQDLIVIPDVIQDPGTLIPPFGKGGCRGIFIFCHSRPRSGIQKDFSVAMLLRNDNEKLQ
jgi:hypothetical protein